MNRAVAFFLLGPASIVAAWLIFAAADNIHFGLAAFLAPFLFGFTVVVALLAALVDRFLARTLPAILRALLTAVVGAMVPVGVVFAVDGHMPSQATLDTFAIGGALCMGICSLLSRDDVVRQWQALQASDERDPPFSFSQSATKE